MLASIKRAANWFIDGLVDAWMMIEGRGRRRLALVRTEDGYGIEPSGGQSPHEPMHIEGSDDGPQFHPRDVAETLRNRDIDIVLAPGEVLVRTLDPLPSESRPYLDSIVQHQLERVAPWRAEDVLHTYRVTPAEHDRLLVTVIATARSLQARVLDAVAALQPRQVRLLCREEQFGGESIPIPVDRGAGEAARVRQLRRLCLAALVLLGVISVGGLGALGWAWYQTDSQLQVVSEAVAAQRHKLVAARTSLIAGDIDLKSMITKRAKTPFIVLALDALSSALPDDTWLTEIHIADGHLRMTGISRNVAGLVPRIEASPAFADATFFAPTTRLPGAEGDRFHLDVRLRPEAEPKS